MALREALKLPPHASRQGGRRRPVHLQGEGSLQSGAQLPAEQTGLGRGLTSFWLSPVDGPSGRLRILAVVNDAAVDVGVQMSLR